jgi:hypothetical protein
MARKPTSPVMQHDDVDTVALEGGTTSLVTTAGTAAQVAEMIGYELPYNKDRIVQEARFYMGQSAETMLEAGRRLILLKENEPHGEFAEIIKSQLGMNYNTAAKMMQAAAKYLSSAHSSNLYALTGLSKTKLFELMVMDDGEIAELAQGGTIAGLQLDDIERMTSRELKAALRDAREDGNAKDTILAKKSELIDKLQTKATKVKPSTPDEEGAQLRRETSDWAFNAEGVIRGSLRDGLEQLARHAEQNDTTHDEFASGLLAQLDRAIAELRSQLGIKAAPDGDPTPEWDKN